MVQDWEVAMMHLELLTRVENIVQDWVDIMHLEVLTWVFAMMKVELLTKVVARVETSSQDCVSAMMSTEPLTRADERMVTIISARQVDEVMSMLTTVMKKLMLDLAILVEKMVVIW